MSEMLYNDLRDSYKSKKYDDFTAIYTAREYINDEYMTEDYKIECKIILVNALYKEGENNLKSEYNQLKTTVYSTMNLDDLRKELKEKEDKINQLTSRNTGYYLGNTLNKNIYNISLLQNTYNELQNENYDLKNKLNLYQTVYNNQSSPISLDNDLNNLRYSIHNNDKIEFINGMTQLRTNLDNATQDNYNTIIMMKDREIEKWKEQERQRREREKQYFNILINKYDQTLNLGEQENQKLKMRLQELQGYFS